MNEQELRYSIQQLEERKKQIDTLIFERRRELANMIMRRIVTHWEVYEHGRPMQRFIGLCFAEKHVEREMFVRHGDCVKQNYAYFKPGVNFGPAEFRIFPGFADDVDIYEARMVAEYADYGVMRNDMLPSREGEEV